MSGKTKLISPFENFTVQPTYVMYTSDESKSCLDVFYF